MNIKPINGCVLVKLTDEYQYAASVEKKYDTKTSGIVVAVADPDVAYMESGVLATLAPEVQTLIGKKVYFEEYKDGTALNISGEKHALIKHSDIRGVEDDA